MLDEIESAELRKMVQVFLEEKHWEGCGGLELTDEIRVTIAAQACLLLLALPHDEYYRNVESILVYPSTVVPPERKPGFFERLDGVVEAPVPILGQAFVQGPVILVWDAVLHGAGHVTQSKVITWSITSLPTSLTCLIEPPTEPHPSSIVNNSLNGLPCAPANS